MIYQSACLWSLPILSKNITKHLVFLCFQDVWKKTSGMKWVKLKNSIKFLIKVVVNHLSRRTTHDTCSSGHSLNLTSKIPLTISVISKKDLETSVVNLNYFYELQKKYRRLLFLFNLQHCK